MSGIVLLTEIYNTMLVDFGTMWMVTLFLSAGFFGLLLAVTRNLEVALVFALLPVTLFAMIAASLSVVLGYVAVLLAIILTVSIARLFFR